MLLLLIQQWYLSLKFALFLWPSKFTSVNSNNNINKNNININNYNNNNNNNNNDNNSPSNCSIFEIVVFFVNINVNNFSDMLQNSLYSFARVSPH